MSENAAAQPNSSGRYHSSAVSIRTHLALSNTVREYLWREFELVKLKNKRYSLSSFSKRLKLSRSFLSDVLRGTRSPSEASVKKIALCLKMNAAECEHLTDLAIVESSQFSSERKHAEKGIRQRKALSAVTLVPVTSADVDLDWYHFAMEELTHCFAAKCSAEWFAEKLQIPVETAAKGIDRIIEKGWVKRGEHGELRPIFSSKEFQTETRRIHRSLFNKVLRSVSHRIEKELKIDGGETWLYYFVDKDQDEQVRKAFSQYLKELAGISQEAREPTELRVMIIADHLLCSGKP